MYTQVSPSSVWTSFLPDLYSFQCLVKELQRSQLCNDSLNNYLCSLERDNRERELGAVVPSVMNILSCFHLRAVGRLLYMNMIHLYYNVINQVILYWSSFGSKDCCILAPGRRLRASTADQGPVTGPIQH